MYSPASLALVNTPQNQRTRFLEDSMLHQVREPDITTLNARIFPSLNPLTRPSHDRKQLIPFSISHTPNLPLQKPIKTSNVQVFPSLHPFSKLYCQKTQNNPNPAFRTPKLAHSKLIQNPKQDSFLLKPQSRNKPQVLPRPAFQTPKLADPAPVKKVKLNDQTEKSEKSEKTHISSVTEENEQMINDFLLEFEEIIFPKKPATKSNKQKKSQPFGSLTSIDMLKLSTDFANRVQEPLVIPDNRLKELAKLRRYLVEFNKESMNGERGINWEQLIKKEECSSSDETEEGYDCKIMVKKEEWHTSDYEESESDSIEMTLDDLLAKNGLFPEKEEDLRNSDILSLLKKEIDPLNVKRESLKQEM